MSYQINNFINNDDVKVIKQAGIFQVIEYQRDLSVNSYTASQAYFEAQMNVRKRQVIANLNNNSVTVQAGAMQWMLGDVNTNTGIKGAGDFLNKMVRGAVTGESAIKPEYKGTGILALEHSYKHYLIIDLDDWNGGIVVEDGMFLACDSEVKHKAVPRSNLSSATLGGEGLFNLGLMGTGFVVLESVVPEEELIEITLNDDVIKIDGNFAVAWSSSLSFTVERSGKSLIGSAASGEGLVNVYRGSGKVLMSPVQATQASQIGKM
ncbi:MAG: AIM24 family protein [Peptostreptococcaceae bacterium]|nr:AIM24 family protein [uncultured Criibacterium sp.]MBS6063111.1 AIM24 family protein [Peptostreptococcaceae bacterium]